MHQDSQCVSHDNEACSGRFNVDSYNKGSNSPYANVRNYDAFVFDHE